MAGETWEFIKSHVNMVAGAVTVLLGPVGLIIAVALEIITHWKTVKAWFDDFWGWMKRTAGDVAGFFTGVWKDISKPLEKEWNHIVDDLTSIWQSLTTIWNATGGKLVHLVSDNWAAISGVVKRALDQIWGFHKGNFQVWTAFIKGGWDLIQGIFHTAWDAVSSVVKAAGDVISGSIKGVMDFIVGVLKASWDVVEAIVKIAWDSVTTIINTALDFLKDVLKFFADLVTGKWGKLWGDVETAAKDAWNNISGLFTRTFDQIWHTVTSAVANIWDGFINGIWAALDGIGKGLSAIWDGVVNFFKDAGKWLWNAGVDIVKGLIGGIESMGNSLIQSVTTLGGLIPKWKGPPEKDKVMLVANGQLIMQGLITGIDSQSDALRKKLEQVTGSITATVNPVLGGSPAVGAIANAPARAAGATTTINVTLPGAQIAGQQSMNWFMAQLNAQFVQRILPQAGVQIARATA